MKKKIVIILQIIFIIISVLEIQSNATMSQETEENLIPITEEMITLDQSNFDYDGTPKKPKITISYENIILSEEEDYTCIYSEDIINAGEPYIIIEGKGRYTGTQKIKYYINKINNDFDFKCDDVVYGQLPDPIILKNVAGTEVEFWYKLSENSLTSSRNKPKNVGTYCVEAVVSGNNNYNSMKKLVTFKILPAENILRITCPSVPEGDIPKPKVTENLSQGKVTFYYKLRNGSDSTYTTTVQVEVGKYTIKAVSEATNNYKQGVAILDFEIYKEPEYKLGDVNADEKINTVDVIMILQHISHKITLDENQILAANTYKEDINDNTINTLDAIRILQYISHKITEF